MNEKLDLESLWIETEDEIYEYIYDELNVPESIPARAIGAHFFSVLASSSLDGSEISQEKKTAVAFENATFELACRSVPHIPVGCLTVLSLVLGAMATLGDPEGRYIEGDDDRTVRTLMAASVGFGAAKVLFQLGNAEIQNKPFEMLSGIDPVSRKRKHHIHHAINVAKRRSSDFDDPGSVWAELTNMAKEKSHALIGVTAKGVQYLDANDEPKEFSKKQLTAYLKGSNLKRIRLP